jgi:Holliday junction resolvase RusA-like endonuclease
MYSLSLSIPWLPESMNCSLRKNRYAQQRINKAWDAYIAAEVYDKAPFRPLKRAKLTIVRHSHRTLDYDGLVGSLKPVVDALVSARIFLDDSWKVLGAWNVDQRFKPKSEGPLLEITIEELRD